ncbi:MAG TPA: tetratricopeptide repeat protein, partial [Candidatus Polarisedimenticolaceae bacterium]
TIGIVYQGLGMGDRATSFLKRALALSESEFGPDSLECAEVLHAIGGIENHKRALRIRQKLLRPDDPRIARSYWHLGLTRSVLGDPEGEADLERGLRIAETSSPPDDQTHLFILNDLTHPASRRGEYARAIELMREALALRERIYHSDHPDMLQGRLGLGWALLLAGRLEEASTYIDQPAIDRLERVVGPTALSVATAIHSLGELQRRRGQLDSARQTIERSMGIYAATLGPDDAGFIDPLTSLGLVDEAQGRTQDAIQNLGRAAAILAKWPGVSSLDPRPDYARLLRKVGRNADAEEVERQMRSSVTAP